MAAARGFWVLVSVAAAALETCASDKTSYDKITWLYASCSDVEELAKNLEQIVYDVRIGSDAKREDQDMKDLYAACHEQKKASLCIRTTALEGSGAAPQIADPDVSTHSPLKGPKYSKESPASLTHSSNLSGSSASLDQLGFNHAASTLARSKSVQSLPGTSSKRKSSIFSKKGKKEVLTDEAVLERQEPSYIQPLDYNLIYADYAKPQPHEPEPQESSSSIKRMKNKMLKKFVNKRRRSSDLSGSSASLDQLGFNRPATASTLARRKTVIGGANMPSLEELLRQQRPSFFSHLLSADNYSVVWECEVWQETGVQNSGVPSIDKNQWTMPEVGQTTLGWAAAQKLRINVGNQDKTELVERLFPKMGLPEEKEKMFRAGISTFPTRNFIVIQELFNPLGSITCERKPFEQGLVLPRISVERDASLEMVSRLKKAERDRTFDAEALRVDILRNVDSFNNKAAFRNLAVNHLSTDKILSIEALHQEDENAIICCLVQEIESQPHLLTGAKHVHWILGDKTGSLTELTWVADSSDKLVQHQIREGERRYLEAKWFEGVKPSLPYGSWRAKFRKSDTESSELWIQEEPVNAVDQTITESDEGEEDTKSVSELPQLRRTGDGRNAPLASPWHQYFLRLAFTCGLRDGPQPHHRRGHVTSISTSWKKRKRSSCAAIKKLRKMHRKNSSPGRRRSRKKIKGKNFDRRVAGRTRSANSSRLLLAHNTTPKNACQRIRRVRKPS